ncbi:type I secretion system permease/ATPase [Duganella violaceipulchra]|uniref:Cyclolysin secretion/processing ATP-binding protein CyaB n=1 Tax=Duganella violaceipulchra TaxID=2849652 RepID=A0AA41HCP2_9BURK|nr:type I secretion system permease/ATPase [Duganella violaceicalia]MBV6322472.1 type I secretion system permease/ATPase [Duganella violaceicalia]MCP2010677.1 ATP-binding cassette subfamily B protein RtxE [Duganella violaceicalia]
MNTNLPNPMMDPGLLALARAAEHFDVAVAPRRLAHRLGRTDGQADVGELCRLAHWIGLRARVALYRRADLATLPTPALLGTRLGFVVLLAVEAESATLWMPAQGRECRLTLAELHAMHDGTVLLLGEARNPAGRVPFGLRWFLPSLQRHRSQFVWVLLVSLVLQLIALVSPLFFSSVVDKVLVSRGIDSLQVLGIGLLALALFEPLYGFIRSWLYGNLASKINAELEGRVYGHLMALPLSYFRHRQAGAIIARIREMDHVRQFLTGSGLTLLLDMVFVVIFLAVMLCYSAVLTGVLALSLLLCFVLWMVIGPLLRERALSAYERNAEANAFLMEAVSGVETIKTSAVEERVAAQWERRLAAYLRGQFATKLMGIAVGQGIGFLQKSTSALMLWFGVHAVLAGKMSVGELVAFNLWAGHVVEPILRLAQIWQDFQHTQIALRRVGDILDEPAEAAGEGVGALQTLDGKVAFRQVRFRYGADSEEVLKGLNVDIEAGRFIGVTGGSGSGKSTLVRLLQRLYTPQQGQILIDGGDIAIADPVELRRQMSIVPQESVLLAGSIADNIRLCKPGASDEEVRAAASLAGADAFIAALPQGFETDVGERGCNLSGGQRQRVALARALLTDPRILILDEATSALDYESEAAIMRRLPEITAGRTVISIAHRLNTIRHADAILVMEDGRVVELGRHEELLGNEGQYAKLWRLQTAES